MQIEFIGEKSISINENQTILDASLQAGLPHFHACGGKGKCSTCRILVLTGEENLSLPNKKETKLRESVKETAPIRLACQTTIKREPVRVERIIKDESDLSQYIQFDDETLKVVKLKALGEEKYLVLFFLDIRNFTPFIEAYLPFDVMYLTRKLFSTFYRIIVQHNGKIIENAGDELYAVFGIESSIKEAADSAISTGHAILDELEKLNKDYLNEYFRKEFEVGIGIHAGKVIIGEFNLGGMAKTSVMGLAVNLASRIQNITKELDNSFIASADVLRHASFKTNSVSHKVNLKGASGHHDVYLLGKQYKKQSNVLGKYKRWTGFK